VLGISFAQEMRRMPDQVSPEDVSALRSAYEYGIRYVDHYVGSLLQALEARDFALPSWVTLTADHGEGFGEHGYFFHTTELHDELIWVPLIVCAPEGFPARPRVEQQVRHLDIPPTILDAAGLPPEDLFEGVSLLPAMLRPDAAGLPAISEVSSRGRWKLALRRDGWKLILHLKPETMEPLSAELYDLRTDPGETANLAGSNPPQLVPLQKQLLEAATSIRQAAHGETAPRAEMDEAVRERLRALGYIE